MVGPDLYFKINNGCDDVQSAAERSYPASVLASPRTKGNSSAIVDAIMDGAMGLSTNVMKLHRLDNLRSIHGCRSCNACKSKGQCVQSDDITEILEDIRNADCVIFSTPVYFGSPNAQYKILEDRMYSFLKADMSSTLEKGKKAIVVVTCSGPVEEAMPIADKMYGVLSSIGFDVIDKFVFSDVGGTISSKDDGELMDRAKILGRNFRNT